MDDSLLPLPPLAPVVPESGQSRPPWSSRVYLSAVRVGSIAVLALLAAGTWWLVRTTPQATPAPIARVNDSEPDYEMRGFSVRRFGSTEAVIQGQRMSHFPKDDEIRIDGATLSFHRDGVDELKASAPEARMRAQANEITLNGGATVERQAMGDDAPLRFKADKMVVDTAAKTLRSDGAVSLQQGRDDITAQGLQYHHVDQRLELKGPVHGHINARTTP